MKKNLPKKMEHAVKTIKHTVKSAYGLIFISGKNVSLPYAFDSHGIIRYYMNFEMKGYYGLMPLANGRYIIYDRKYLCPTYLLPYCTQIYEGDLFGRFHKVFYLPKGCHHDACEKEPGGNLMLITNSLKKQLGDVVIEVDRNTGEIADQLDFRHILGNAHRDMMGWIHLNTVTYDNKEDTLLICARNLHSVCNIRWKTKKLLWILADPRFWEGTEYESKVLKPDRETSWFYQPHTSYWVSQNQLAVFDNHWHKRRPVPYFDEDPASYVKLFRVDETKHTVSLEHSYRGEKSKITSNPRVEPAKKRVFSMEGTLEPLINGHGGMVYEYDYDTEEVLNQYLIQDYYYRGYEFLPEYDRLAEKMELDQNYVAGFLTRPKEVEHNITIPDQSFSELGAADKKDLIFELSDDTVYIRARDHRIKCVYFVGKNYTYKRDFRKPPQYITDL